MLANGSVGGREAGRREGGAHGLRLLQLELDVGTFSHHVHFSPHHSSL